MDEEDYEYEELTPIRAPKVIVKQRCTLTGDGSQSLRLRSERSWFKSVVDTPPEIDLRLLKAADERESLEGKPTLSFEKWCIESKFSEREIILLANVFKTLKYRVCGAENLEFDDYYEKCSSKRLYLQDVTLLTSSKFDWIQRGMFGWARTKFTVAPFGAALLTQSMFQQLSICTSEGTKILTGYGVNTIEEMYRKYNGFPAVPVKSGGKNYLYFYTEKGYQLKQVSYVPKCSGEVIGNDIFCPFLKKEKDNTMIEIDGVKYWYRRSPRLDLTDLSYLKENDLFDGVILLIKGREYKLKFQHTYDILHEGRIIEVSDYANPNSIIRERPDKLKPDSDPKRMSTSHSPLLIHLQRLTKPLCHCTLPEEDEEICSVPSYGIIACQGAETGEDYALRCRELYNYIPTQDQLVSFVAWRESDKHEDDKVPMEKCVKNGYFRFSLFTNLLKRHSIPFTYKRVRDELLKTGAVRLEADQFTIIDISKLGLFRYDAIYTKDPHEIVVTDMRMYSRLSRLSAAKLRLSSDHSLRNGVRWSQNKRKMRDRELLEGKCHVCGTPYRTSLSYGDHYKENEDSSGSH